MKKTLVLCGMLVLSSQAALAAEWVDLFDGSSLNGWSVHSGFAKYEVDKGTILGTAQEGSPNTFLCTDKEYADFILEFEVKCDPKLNSGVQFRSTAAPREMVFIFRGNDNKPRQRVIPADRVFGYQVEVADEGNGSSGGVYDEARRGFFLDGPEEGSEASTAFKNNQWNKYRVECRGDSIKTWINGVMTADFRDSISASGVIGLQVHGLGKKAFKPYEVRWRNIRLQELE